jgi:hypothetical protein
MLEHETDAIRTALISRRFARNAQQAPFFNVTGTLAAFAHMLLIESCLGSVNLRPVGMSSPGAL